MHKDRTMTTLSGRGGKKGKSKRARGRYVLPTSPPHTSVRTIALEVIRCTGRGAAIASAAVAEHGLAATCRRTNRRCRRCPWTTASCVRKEW